MVLEVEGYGGMEEVVIEEEEEEEGYGGISIEGG